MATFHHRIKKGLRIPVKLTPSKDILKGEKVLSVAIVGPDYHGLKPALKVQEGQHVKQGETLFTDKRFGEAVAFTSPGGGEVVAINRGERRKLLSVVIKLDPNEEAVEFDAYSQSDLKKLSHEQAKSLLLRSGMWTCFRRRPFSFIPSPDETPNALFVTAIDTNPYAPDVKTILNQNEASFYDGLQALSRLVDCPIHVATAPSLELKQQLRAPCQHHVFSGRHPAGLVGTHIHFIEPASASHPVWHLNYQDVIAIGKLFVTGKLFVERYVSMAGNVVEAPCILKTRLGASLQELITHEPMSPKESRIISGSILSGREASGPLCYLGRYHQSVCLLEEDRARIFQGFLSPGLNLFSNKRVFLSSFFRGRTFNFTTATRGSVRDMVPIGSYERVVPLRIIPTFLLRALLSNDLNRAEALGALELDEEDLALCSFVCPGKQDYGVALRKTLNDLAKEFE